MTGTVSLFLYRSQNECRERGPENSRSGIKKSAAERVTYQHDFFAHLTQCVGERKRT